MVTDINAATFIESSVLLGALAYFIGYIKYRDKIMQELHKNCEARLEAITNRALNAFDRNFENLEKKIDNLVK